jgi:peptidoglycan/LPS O-acetylase OafA/YrhL
MDPFNSFFDTLYMVLLLLLLLLLMLQVRMAGGIEVLAAALSYLAAPGACSSSSSSSDNSAIDNTQLACWLLVCLARLVEGNAASRMGLREAGGLAAAAGLMQQALQGLGQQQQQQEAGPR